jgi:DNA-binding MarR family transcriptional regulator
MSKLELEQAIEKLDRAKLAPSLALTRDEQRVLDYLVQVALGSPTEAVDREFRIVHRLLAPGAAAHETYQPPTIAEALGMPLHHVRAVLNSLVEKGCLERHSGPAS